MKNLPQPHLVKQAEHLLQAPLDVSDSFGSHMSHVHRRIPLDQRVYFDKMVAKFAMKARQHLLT